MTRASVTSALLAALVLGADLAAAIDLTGTWVPKKTSAPCRHIFPGGTDPSRHGHATLEITQTANTLLAKLASTVTGPHRGAVLEKPDARGVGAMHYCGATTDTATLEILSATTFPPDADSVSGRMWLRLFVAQNSEAGYCRRVEWIRIDTADPALPPCP